MGMKSTLTTTVVAIADSSAPARLSEDEAWEIAMTWQPQLQGKVRLVVDRDGPVRSIIESYAWVRLDTPRPLSEDQDDDAVHDQELTAITRAVMLSWAALTACPGYSGSENGTFWKRVLSALQEQASDQRGYFASRDRPEQVTDAHGFFVLPGHVFPRFLVDSALLFDEVSGKFFPSCLAPAVDATLQSLLERLSPYTRAGPLQTIDIGLHMATLDVDGEKYDLPALVRAVNASAGRRFNICQIQFRHQVLTFSEARLPAIRQFLRLAALPLGHLHLIPRMHNASPADRASLLQALLRLEGSSVRARATSLRFSRNYMHDAMFQALMSALPFATSVHTLAFGMGSTWRERLFDQADLPWIAYAIFHPHAASSSWRHLELDALPLTPRSTDILMAMARGNNLLALLIGNPPESEAYYTAEIMGGTLLHMEPNRDSAVLYEVPSTGTTVDVCSITSLDRTTWSVWVTVIVPAYGLGWVTTSRLYNERAETPATPSLTGLHLRRKANMGANAHNAPVENLLHLLPPLGASLKYLNISLKKSVDPTALRKILGLCPSLKVLVVKHAGELWSESFKTEETQLEELELVVKSSRSCIATPTRGHMRTSLRRLRALRIRVNAQSGDHLQASRSALEQVLYHAVLLRDLHWQRPSQSVVYAPRLDWTRVKLVDLQLIGPQYLYAQLPMSSACAVAFLSVVAHASQHSASALGELVDRGVLMLIFQFATTPVRRSIYIEGNGDNGEASEVNNE